MRNKQGVVLAKAVACAGYANRYTLILTEIVNP
jgi:hypothetical protein